MKYKEKLIAIKLKKAGKSYCEILKVIKVSRGTLSLWLRDIKIDSKNRKKVLIGREKSRY